MLISRTKLLATLTLCSATTLGACAMDDGNNGDGATVNSDSVASDGAANSGDVEQDATAVPEGIAPGINISIAQWQIDLRAWQLFFATCRPTITVDGDFGSMTTAATECFQRVLGLTPDGVAGPVTYGTMCGELNGMKRHDLFTNSNC